MLVVDPWHWLDKDGNPPTDNLRLRRQVLRVARFIEYGGCLKKLESRETLMECKRRPKGKSCLGLMWVAKTEGDAINAFCRTCGDEAMIHNWQETEWAAGMMEAVPPDTFPDDNGGPATTRPFARN